MNDLSKERIAEVSERSLTTKWFLKVPMLLLISLAGLVSGTSVLLLKVGDTILQHRDFSEHWPMLTLIGLLTIATADTQLQFLNVAMKLYD